SGRLLAGRAEGSGRNVTASPVGSGVGLSSPLGRRLQVVTFPWAGGQVENAASHTGWDAPGPASPPPVSNRTRTRGSCLMNAARAASGDADLVKRMAGIGPIGASAICW